MSNPDAERLMKRARMRLPGALDDAIRAELYNAADELFQDSSCWQEDISVAVTAGDDEYTLTPASTANIVRLVGVLNSADCPVDATLELPDNLVLRFEPAQAETFTATVVLSVSGLDADDFPNLPAWVWDRHSNALLDGVLSKMMTQPAKPYSNERMSVYHMRRFRNAVAAAKVAAHHRNLEDGQRWRFPGGWR
jgi:hypothetical protein